MRTIRIPDTMPSWARQGTRAVIALCLGVLVGFSAAVPQLLVAVALVLVALLVTASLRRPDPLVFLAFMFIAMPAVHLPGSPLPLGESLMLLAVFSAFLTLKKGLDQVPRWALFSALGLFGVYVLSAVVNGLHHYTTVKRIVHLLVYVMALVGLVRGLLQRRIALRGIQVGLAISVFVGIVLLPTSFYKGRLTGLFGDPNVAGLVIVVLGSIALAGIRNRRYQVAYAVLLLVGLVLTFSRTALLAAILIALWVWVGRKLRPIPALAAVLVTALVIGVLPTSLQSIGPFNDRTGSDQLRNRVSAQEFKVVKEKPVLGHGPGTATVLVNFGTTKFYFHNSYLALIEEGGVLALIPIGILLIGTLFAMIALDTTDRQPLLEGALIGVAVMAINLGEVLVELSAAVAIGYALAYLASLHRRQFATRPLERVA